MPNLSKLYHDITSIPADELPVEELLTAGQTELKFNWLNSTVTQEVFKKLLEDEKELITKAVSMACSSEPQYLRIVQILVRVDTLRRLQKEFSNTNNIKPNIPTAN